MDEQFLKTLETRAYYAVVRAFAASAKLNFETESVLMDLQQALDINDDTAMELMAQVDEDLEAKTLKGYNSSITKAQPGAAQGAVAQAVAVRPAAAARPANMGAGAGNTTYPMDTPFSQPAAKKQKKAGGSLPPPASIRAAAPAASPQAQQAQKPAAAAGAHAAGGGAAAARPRQRSVPSTPQGGASAAAARAAKTPRPTLSAANFMRVMQRGVPEEMEGYFTELHSREREIFVELIAMGVEETDPSLNDLHRELLRWYKLDQRQAMLSQQLAVA